jgi:hypothetical protein
MAVWLRVFASKTRTGGNYSFAGLISRKRHRFDATQERGSIGIEWHLQYPPLTSVKLEAVPCSSLLKTPPPMLCSNLSGDEARRIASNIVWLRTADGFAVCSRARRPRAVAVQTH